MNKLDFCKKGFITAGTIIVLFLSMPFASSIVMRQQTADLIYSSIDTVPERDAALVLGAAAYPSRLSDILRDRMDTAIDLYNADKVKILILSGAPNEAEGMKKYAIDNHIPENDIIEDPKGLNTHLSILNSKLLLNNIIIVSQAFHLPRSVFLARHYGMDAVGAAADRHEYIKIFDFKKRELLASTKAMMELFLF